MPTRVALLRGINVGGRNLVPMAELRDLFAGLGHRDVRTYIQSGNVVFTSEARPDAQEIESAIEERFRVTSTVVLRSAADLKRIAALDPFGGTDRAKLHVGFLVRSPRQSAVSSLDQGRFLPERFSFAGQEVYLHLPDGMARTKLPDYLGRQLKLVMTIRNWNTVNKLLEICQA